MFGFARVSAPRTLWVEAKDEENGYDLCWSSRGTGKTEGGGGGEGPAGEAGSNRVALTQIVAVRRGRATAVLRARGDKRKENCYFSLIVTQQPFSSRGKKGSAAAEEEEEFSLDLEASSEERRNVLASHFETLLERNQ